MIEAFLRLKETQSDQALAAQPVLILFFQPGQGLGRGLSGVIAAASR